MNTGALDPDLLKAAARACMAAKDFAGAAAAFGSLSKWRPKDAHFADMYAHCCSSQNLWPLARDAWTTTIEKNGKNVRRTNQLARCYIEMREYDAAQTMLASNRDDIKVNPHFFAFQAIAFLGTGQIERAFESTQQMRRLADEENLPMIDHFTGRLNRLAAQGHSEAVLALLGLLLVSTIDQARLLKSAIHAAGLLKRHQAKFDYAAALARLEPDLPEGSIHQMYALFDLGCIDECQRLFIEVVERFPKVAWTSRTELQMSLLEYRLASTVQWKRLLLSTTACLTFENLNFRTAAHMTLRQYHRAIEVASVGVASHARHPWFMAIIGRCHEKLGDWDAAIHWLTRATETAPARLSFWLDLFQVQFAAGRRNAALGTAEMLIRRHPKVPAVQAALKKLDENFVENAFVRARAVDLAPLQGSWLHGGDSGDLIYALAAMQGGGGGQLYLTCIEETREPMNERKIEFLHPLLTAQHYIQSVEAWQGQPIGRDFTVFRHLMLPDIDLATQQWRCVLEDLEPEVRTSWLTVPEITKHGRPVFGRSARYRNQSWDTFWQELKAASPEALFVGTAAEFEEFGHGEHYFARDALDLARVIAGAAVFVGNQSLPYAMAEAMKVERMLEASPLIPNCIFPGVRAQGPLGVAEPPAPG